MKKNGFTLLYTVLISSIVLAIGLGAFNLVLGQIILAGNAYQSAIAIYAADAGIECAKYWDYNFNPVNPSSEKVFNNDGVEHKVRCFGDTIGRTVGNTFAAEFRHDFTYTLQNGAEVMVEVFKDKLKNGSSFDQDGRRYTNPNGTPHVDGKTVIYAYGKNNTSAGPRTLERVLLGIHGNPY